MTTTVFPVSNHGKTCSFLLPDKPGDTFILDYAQLLTVNISGNMLRSRFLQSFRQYKTANYLGVTQRRSKIMKSFFHDKLPFVN